MNAKQAKQIPLFEILHRLGHDPVKEIRGELWYSSPFRKEKEPSFKINSEKNVWFDFGRGGGGNVLDFIMTDSDSHDVATALRLLEELMGSPGRQISPPRAQPLLASLETESDQTPLQIEKIQPLQNKALVGYLKQRGIEKPTASPYVKEIYYSLKGKNDFALAFPSLSGGYELRNSDFKGGIGKKDISLLVKRKSDREDSEATSSVAVTVFEGFMDFLSALTFYQVKEAKTAVIVLNSVSFSYRAIKKIKEMGVTQVDLYLDQDDGGKQGIAYFRQHLGSDISLRDPSSLYAGYKDFNDF
jgi:DNA primase